MTSGMSTTNLTWLMSKSGCASDWWQSEIDIKLASWVLHLRIGLLKFFLAGSKKTRQGPGWRVGALGISRCWFYLTVVAVPKQIQKDYKIIWCCVLLCYGSCYAFMIHMLMIYKWWSDRCLWNDYANGRIMHWWISCWLLKLKNK